MSLTIEPIVPFSQELIVPEGRSKLEPMVTKRKARSYLQFSERLGKACDTYGLPQKGRPRQLGALVGIGYKGAEKWLNGDGMPDMGHATLLAEELGISFEWLMTGRSEAKAQGGALSRHEEAIVDIYRQLPPSGRKRFLDMLYAFATACGINVKRVA